MEYVYAALLLHKAGKEINEENIKKILEAADIKADEARIKALVAALEGINIEEAIQKASVQQVQVAAGGATQESETGKEEKKEKKPEEEKKKVEEAAAGLGALFG